MYPEPHNHWTRDIKPAGQCPACDLRRLSDIKIFEPLAETSIKVLERAVTGALFSYGGVEWVRTRYGDWQSLGSQALTAKCADFDQDQIIPLYLLPCPNEPPISSVVAVYDYGTQYVQEYRRKPDGWFCGDTGPLDWVGINTWQEARDFVPPIILYRGPETIYDRNGLTQAVLRQVALINEQEQEK